VDLKETILDTLSYMKTPEEKITLLNELIESIKEIQNEFIELSKN
jgi:hypothetical protein